MLWHLSTRHYLHPMNLEFGPYKHTDYLTIPNHEEPGRSDPLELYGL